MLEKTKVVIIGNGFGGIYTLRNLHKLFHKKEKVHLTLIGKKNYFLFTPLLHEVATGSINPANIVEPIRKVLGCCLSELYLGKAEKINTKEKTIIVGENIISYDYLVIALGSETNFYNIKGAETNSFTLKSIEDAIKIKNHIIRQVESASHIKDVNLRKKILSFVVIGGGPTGVELIAEINELVKESLSKYYKKEIVNDASFTIIQKQSELLPQFNKKIREKSLKTLRDKGVNVLLDSEVKEVGDLYLLTNNGRKIETKTAIWVAGIKPQTIEFDKEILKSKDNKLLVNEYLQILKEDNIFALGDNTSFLIKGEEQPLPALAQVAEKESKTVAKNIYLSVKNKKLKPFVYKHSGNMVSLGQWMAIGEISNFVFWGHITWWLWRTLYLSKLISFRKKVRVALDWTINLFSPRDISEL